MNIQNNPITPSQHIRTQSAPPRLTTTPQPTVKKNTPSLKPRVPLNQKDLKLQLQRENITSQVGQVKQLLADIEQNVATDNHGANKALYAKLKKLSPPFLNPGKIGKTIPEVRTSQTTPEVLKTHSIEKLAQKGFQGIDPQETRWENIKSTFIRSDHSSDVNMMMALDVRHNEISNLMSKVGEDMGLPVIMPGQEAPQGPHVIAKICGSTELSSDIDINITAVGCPPGKDTQFVRKFNRAYQVGNNKQESGNDFDVNLYTKGVFPDFEKENVEGRFKWQDKRAEGQNNKYQDIASLVKVRKFAGNQWKTFSNHLIRATPVGERAQVTRQLEKTGAFVSEAESQITGLKTRLKKDPKYAKMNAKELDLVVNNRLYEKHSKTADNLLKSYEKSGDEKQLASARFSLSKAHFFANEAALSEGVLRRVVVNEQAISGINKGREGYAEQITEKRDSLKNLKLEQASLDTTQPQHQVLEQQIVKLEAQLQLMEQNPSQPLNKIEVNTADGLQSFNENFGDILKEISHHSESVESAMVKSSKYLGRMCRDVDALKGSLSPQQQKKLASNPKMQQVMQTLERFGQAEGYRGDPERNLLAIRKGRLSSDQASNILQESGINYTTAQEYEQAIVQLSVDINVLFRSHITMY